MLWLDDIYTAVYTRYTRIGLNHSRPWYNLYLIVGGRFLPRDAQRGLCRHAVCVGPSVTFVHSVKTNKHIFKIFSPSSSQTILVFPYQTSRQYSDGNSLTGALNAGGVGKIAISDQYLASSRAVNAATG